VNPFVLTRTVLCTPWAPERVLATLDELLRDGFLTGERRHRLFGWRRGRTFSLSLGMPVVGGGEPVVRGHVRDDAGSSLLDVSVGARLSMVLLIGFWMVITVVGGCGQVYLQVRGVYAGGGSWSTVLEVLPGIAIMAALSFGGLALWRHRNSVYAGVLIERLCQPIGASIGVPSGHRPPPIPPRHTSIT
jgi:hypothetical protein